MRVIMQCTDFKSVKIVVRRGRRSQCPGIMLGSSNYQQLIPDNTNKSQSRISNLCHTTRLFIQQLSLHFSGSCSSHCAYALQKLC